MNLVSLEVDISEDQVYTDEAALPYNRYLNAGRVYDKDSEGV